MNMLLHDTFCDVIHHLPKLQNMHPYRIASDTDIPVVVNGASGAWPMSPAVLKDEGGDGGEDGGSGFRDGDFLHAGEYAADNVAADDEGEACLAVAAGAVAAPAASAGP